MPQKTALTEQISPPDQKEPESLTEEEEEEALEAEDRRKMSRLARGCLEMAVLMLVLAGVFLVMELKAHLSVLYVLPPYTLVLGCVAASFFSMMAGLFSVRRTAFAMMVMVLGGWMVLFVMAMIYLQEPETIVKSIPGTEQSVLMTLVSTPISSSLYIEEPIKDNLLSKRWKFPVHGKNIPLDELITLKEAKDGDTVQLFFEGRLWAVFDPETGNWADVLQHEMDTEDPVETTENKRKYH